MGRKSNPLSGFDIEVSEALGSANQYGTAAFAINHMWNALSTFFTNARGYKVSYHLDVLSPNVVAEGRTGQFRSVHLNKGYFNGFVAHNSELTAVLLHETFHAIGWGHNRIDRTYSIMNESTDLKGETPFLRLDDFWSMRQQFAMKVESAIVNGQQTTNSVYQWQQSQEGNWFTTNFGQNVRSFYLTYLYDILYDDAGINRLDFSNFKNALRVDLRPSVFVNNHVDPHQVRGTLVLGAAKWGQFNLYNAPNAKLHEAVGGSGHDVIVGNDHDNMLDGGLGNDTLVGLKGCDTLRGGGEIDTVDYSQDADSGGFAGVVVNLAKKARKTNFGTIKGQYGRDGFGDVDQLSNIENAIGSSKNDRLLAAEGGSRLQGLDGDDILWGFDGKDFLDGGDANDRLFGLGGNDTLVGGGGADTLAGQNGNDILTGGGGADLFCFHLRYGKDTVTDFKRSEGDTLQIDTRLAKDWTELQKAIRLRDGNLILNFGRDTLTLQGVNSLSVGDVRFVSG